MYRSRSYFVGSRIDPAGNRDSEEVRDKLTHTPIESRREVSLWRNRDYVILWSGQTVSSIGSGVSELAFPLLILALTHSPAQAGFAAAVRTIPYLIFSLLAGAFVDRWNRKRTMILCDIARALVLGAIPFTFAFGLLTIWQLYFVTFIEGTLYVFFSLAEAAALPHVVEKTQLPSATAMHMRPMAWRRSSVHRSVASCTPLAVRSPSLLTLYHTSPRPSHSPLFASVSRRSEHRCNDQSDRKSGRGCAGSGTIPSSATWRF